MDDDDDAYRMRPDGAGVYIIHLRRVFGRVDGFLCGSQDRLYIRFGPCQPT